MLILLVKVRIEFLLFLLQPFTADAAKRLKVSHAKLSWNDIRFLASTNDFKTFILHNDLYVDKSLMIKEFIESEERFVSLIRPKRHGKSLNLGMVQQFLERKLLLNGTPSPDNTISRKLFTGGDIQLPSGDTKHFQPLMVSIYSSIMKYHGRFPVIFLNAGHLKGQTFDETIINIKTRVQNVFREHLYLGKYTQQETTLLSHNEKELLERYLSGNIDINEVKNSLKFLCKLLHTYHNEKVYVLIDDYDSLIREIHLNRTKNQSNFTNAVQVLVHIYGNTFRDNPHVEKGLLTGVLPFAIYQLGDIKRYTVFEKKFSPYYSFSATEVKRLIRNIQPKVKYEHLSKWYKSYNYGGTFTFNPFSTIQFLSKQGACSTYFSDPETLEFFKDLFFADEVQSDLQRLMCGEGIVKQIFRSFTPRDMKSIEIIFHTLLVFSGYLNADPINETSTGRCTRCILYIPNKEIRLVLQNYCKKKNRKTERASSSIGHYASSKCKKNPLFRS